VRVKRIILLIALVVLAVILAGSSTSVVSDTGSSPIDRNIPDSEITAGQAEARSDLEELLPSLIR